MGTKPRLLRGRDAIRTQAENLNLSAPQIIGGAIIQETSYEPALRSFLLAWAGVFLLLVLLSGISEFSPVGVREIAGFIAAPFGTSKAETENISAANGISTDLNEKSFPPRIAIPAINVNAPLIFPETGDPDILNAALAKGAVRYPDSALPGEKGNLFIFGHSTGLAAVRNKNYGLFNRFKELKTDDAVKIRYGDREFLYLVKKLEVKEADDAKINLAVSGKILTLSTCRIIGGKESRYVITAEFLRSYPPRSYPTSVDTSSEI